MDIELTAVYQKVPEGYIGFVEELPGANTQGATLEETRANLQEAVHLVLEANRTLAQERLRGKEVIRESISASPARSASTYYDTSKYVAASSCAKAEITRLT